MFSTQVVIGDILPRTQATATLNQTVFGTNWTANAASDVVVYQTPFGDDPDDVTQQLTSNQFSVAFIGALQQVQVTLVVPAAAGDIITVTRQTPADRENLYTNTNFTPTMLNQDFGILTLVDQQAQLVDQLIGPRYNYSAVIIDVIDTILPILGASQIWVKNSGNTAIIALDVPTSGFAPANGTYILQTPNAALPSAQALSAFGANGILAWNNGTTQIVETSVVGTTNQITVANGSGIGTIGVSIANNPVIPGTAGMGIPQGTTGQRVIPASGINLRFNTTLDQIEYFDPVLASWVGIPSMLGGVLTVPSGGTGISSTTPFGILTGGTTPTAPFQNVGTSGTFGQFLMFDTTTSLPVWRTAESKYIVGPTGPYTTIQSAINQAVSDGAAANNILNVLVTEGVYTENLVLADFVDIAGTGAQDCVVILGNAVYTSVAVGGSFSTRGVTYHNNVNANPTISIQGANACNVNIAQCNIDGITSNAFENLNANANIEKSTCKLTAAAGFKVANIVGGTIRVIAGFATEVDTPSTISGGANFAILSCFDTNSFIVTGSSTFSVTNSVIIPPGTQTFLDLDVTSVGIILFSSILSNSVSGFYVEGTGTVIIGGVNTIVGTADTIDPGITIFAPGTQFSGIKLLNQSNAISMNSNFITNTLDPVNPQDVATKNYVDTQSPGSGTVSAGLINELAWYAANGTTVSGLPTANNGLLVTDAGGVPSISSTLPSGLTIPGYIRSINVQVILATATYTPTAGTLFLTTEITGAGGGSGGSSSGVGTSGPSSGGGGGGFCRKTYTIAQLGSNAAVVIGAGGTAGASGTGTGGTGGNSTFTPAGAGSVLTASGGIGGGGSFAATATTGIGGNGGAGGAATGGDLNIPGGPGELGFVLSGSAGQGIGGAGGASHLGNVNFNPSDPSNAGTSPTNYGNGASGAINASGANTAGAVGGVGFCIITEYIS